MISTIDASVAAIEGFEGRVPWIYADTKGNPTVGVGKLLATVEDAQALPFQIEGFGQTLPATESEIDDDWNKVKNAVPGQPPSFYHWAGSVFLLDENINTLLRYTVIRLDADMPQIYASYATWPQPAQLAVLDMGFNLGLSRLASEYVHMNAALRSGPPNFIAASHFCGRDTTDEAFDARNNWTVAQFNLAAKINPSTIR